MSENKRSTAGLRGHALYREGAAVSAEGNLLMYRPRNGHGKCSCGAISPLLTSGMKRKQWHREHKAEIRANTP